MNLELPRTFLRPRSAVRKKISAMLRQLRKDSELSLHLGCGPNILPDTINCDLHNEAADRQVNSCNLSEFADGSAQLIEHHHMIEHLSFEEAEQGMREWARVLAPGGYLVCTCPDLPAVLRHWLRSNHGERWDYGIQMIYGSQEHPGMFHRSGYDRRYLHELFDRHGLDVIFTFAPYPKRATPSLLVIGQKRA